MTHPWSYLPSLVFSRVFLSISQMGKSNPGDQVPDLRSSSTEVCLTSPGQEAKAWEAGNLGNGFSPVLLRTQAWVSGHSNKLPMWLCHGKPYQVSGIGDTGEEGSLVTIHIPLVRWTQ